MEAKQHLNPVDFTVYLSFLPLELSPSFPARVTEGNVPANRGRLATFQAVLPVLVELTIATTLLKTTQAECATFLPWHWSTAVEAMPGTFGMSQPQLCLVQ